MLSILDEDHHQNILDHKSSILENIAFGSKYFSTSSPKILPTIGEIKIVATIIINQKNAYLIVLIAGFIFSSFHQDNITKTHHRSIKITVAIDANKTRIDTAKSKNSPKSIAFQNIDVVCSA